MGGGGLFDLLGRAPKSSRLISKAPCLRTRHSELEFGGSTNPHTSVHPHGIPPALHSGVLPLTHREPGVCERFFKGTVILLLGARFASPTCAVEVTRDKTSVLLQQLASRISMEMCTVSRVSDLNVIGLALTEKCRLILVLLLHG